jgi:adenosylcobyric acid synthase
MLGRRILDPDHVESQGDEIEGLGLLDVVTTFAAAKRTVLVEGELLSDALGAEGTPLRGYEIHMGRSVAGVGVASLLRVRGADGQSHDDGAVSVEGVVCGSYVHGLFDHPALRAAFLNRLRAALGLPPQASLVGAADADIDRLADHLEAHFDGPLLESIVGLEPR